MADATTSLVVGSATGDYSVRATTREVVARLNSKAFLTIVSRVQAPLIVMKEAGLTRRKYKYLTSYKGVLFYTWARERLELPKDADIVVADSMPGAD
jgi:uncharacterized UPF0146 family protein